MAFETPKEPRRHYLPAAGHDLFLPLYDPLVRLLGGDRARRMLVTQANIQAGQRILDIGCGTGTLVIELKRQHADVYVVGLDPDPKALSRAKSKANRAGISVQLDQGYADALRYESGTFDRVLSSFMFHHLEEESREKALREIVRVLKSSGSFHLLDFVADESGSHGFLERLLHSPDRLKDNYGKKILQMMTRAGFKDVKKTCDDRMFFGLLPTAYFCGGVDWRVNC